MSNKTNIINNILLLVGFLASVLVVVLVGGFLVPLGNKSYLTLLSVPVFILINTFFHEIAHIISGKNNGFKTISFKILGFRFRKVDGKLKVNYVGIGEQIGEAEIIPVETKELKVRYKKVAKAGITANLIMTFLSIALMIFWKIYVKDVTQYNNVWFYLTAFALPISFYFFLCNALPMTNDLNRNDGAYIYGINHNEPEVSVMFSLMEAHALIYQGYTPSQVPEDLYFNVPQIREDDPIFIVLLNNRYCYYLDKGDYNNAKLVIKRLEELSDFIPKYMYAEIQTELLFAYSSFMLDEDTADDVFEDNDKYLNKVLSVTTLRAKGAYVKNVIKDEVLYNDIYQKALQLADEIEVKGLSLYEKNIIKKLNDGFNF
jgi:hypothetical protein